MYVYAIVIFILFAELLVCLQCGHQTFYIIAHGDVNHVKDQGQRSKVSTMQGHATVVVFLDSKCQHLKFVYGLFLLNLIFIQDYDPRNCRLLMRIVGA